jgi:glycosyltransferase involved in cell wall biosynthesis
MKLSLLLPTYNRPENVEKLLFFLNEELDIVDIKGYEIEFILGDNSSDNETQRVCLESTLYGKGFLSYVKNESNLGLIGNVVNLINNSKGSYSWVLGDDDYYHRGILKKVYELVELDIYSFIFINHRAYIIGKVGETGFSSAIDVSKSDVYEDAKELVFDVWNYSQTSLMFLSSSVYRSENLKECLEVESKRMNIAFPLYMSFYCSSKGKGFLIKEIFIDNIWGETSWQDLSSDVFNCYVPKNLYILPKLGYSYFLSRRILINYLFGRLSAEVINFLLRMRSSFKQ